MDKLKQIQEKISSFEKDSGIKPIKIIRNGDSFSYDDGNNNKILIKIIDFYFTSIVNECRIQFEYYLNNKLYSTSTQTPREFIESLNQVNAIKQ